MNERVLVTGGSGFIGRYLLPKLADIGYQVISVDLDVPTVMMKDIDFKRLDLRDWNATYKIISEIRPYAVVHLASPLSDRTESNLAVAGEGALIYGNVIEASVRSKVDLFIYISSLAVYGTGAKHYPPTPLTEDIPPVPNTVYGALKLYGEHLLINNTRRYPRRSVILRFSVVLGKGRRTGLTSQLIRSIVEDRLHITLPGPPDLPLDWIDVRDAVDVVVSSLEKDVGSEIYNVSAERVTLGTLGNILHEVLPETKIEYLDVLPPIRPPPQGFSTEKIRKATGWEPRYTIKDTIRWILGDS